MGKAKGGLRAKIRISVRGDFAERFYNLAVAEGIRVTKLCRLGGGTLAMTLPASKFRSLLPLRRKTRVHIKILSKSGFVFRARPYRRRYGLAIGAALCAALVVLCSQFIWSVRIEGEPPDRAALTAALTAAGLREGVWRTAVDTQQVEQQLLSSGLGLSFASVRLRGSRAEVQVVYAREKPPIEPTEPCNLVAACDGVITYMQVSEGQAVVEKGMAVKKGELLVSGIIDSQQVGYRVTHASGSVWARVSEKRTARVEYENVSSERTGREYEIYTLRFFCFYINLYSGTGIKYDVYDIINSEKEAAIGDFILPLSIITHRVCERRQTICSLAPEEAAESARRMLAEEAGRDFFGGDFTVVSVTLRQLDGCCEAVGEYVRVRDIASESPLDAE